VSLLNNKIVDVCKDLVNDISTKKEFKLLMHLNYEVLNKMNSLIKTTVNLLNSLMEGRNNPIIFNSIAENLRFDFLMQNLLDEYVLFVKRKTMKKLSKKQGLSKFNIQSIFDKIKLGRKTKVFDERRLQSFYDSYKRGIKIDFFDEEITEGFNIFFFLININEETGIFERKIRQLKGKEKIAFNFFNDNSQSIEIVFKGILQRVYFVVHPACSFLSNRSKKTFMDHVNRESCTQKLKDFIKTSPKFVDEMEFTITKKSSSLINMILDQKTMRNVSFLVSSIINILIVMNFRLNIENSDYKVEFQVLEGYKIFMYLGIVHLIASFLLLTSWMRQTGPLVVMDKWREVCSDLEKRLKYDLKTNKKAKGKIKNILSKNVIQ
jgi:hypothetical protein